MEGVEFFVKLRDVSNEVVVAYESKDESAIETALGKFMILMVQADALM